MIASTFDVAFNVVVVIASKPNVAFDVVLNRFDARLEIDSKQIHKLDSIALLEKQLKRFLVCDMFKVNYFCKGIFQNTDYIFWFTRGEKNKILPDKVTHFSNFFNLNFPNYIHFVEFKQGHFVGYPWGQNFGLPHSLSFRSVKMINPCQKVPLCKAVTYTYIPVHLYVGDYF